MIKRFIDCYKDKDVPTEYDAGFIVKDDNEYIITQFTLGAEKTFSIGQSIYDRNCNLMGYLGIGLYNNLNYSADIRIPCDKWVIIQPTEHCKAGKQVFTYWQNEVRKREVKRNEYRN